MKTNTLRSASTRLKRLCWILALFACVLQTKSQTNCSILYETFSGSASPDLTVNSPPGTSVTVSPSDLVMKKHAGIGNVGASAAPCFLLTGDFTMTVQATRTVLTNSGEAGIE